MLNKLKLESVSFVKRPNTFFLLLLKKKKKHLREREVWNPIDKLTPTQTDLLKWIENGLKPISKNKTDFIKSFTKS